jgi:hypothetical protein
MLALKLNFHGVVCRTQLLRECDKRNYLAYFTCVFGEELIQFEMYVWQKVISFDSCALLKKIHTWLLKA